MFIRRESKVLNVHNLPKVCAPEHAQSDQSHSVDSVESRHSHKPDEEINRYPFLEYLVSFCMFLLSVYMFASFAGISWGISFFQEREWWQFTISALILAFSIAIMFNADSEQLTICKKNDELFHCESKFFCLFKKCQSHKISEIIGVQIRECGAAKKVSLHTRWYGNEISFKNCKKITILRCISEQNAERYKQRILKTINISKVSKISQP